MNETPLPAQLTLADYVVDPDALDPESSDEFDSLDLVWSAEHDGWVVV